MRLSFVVQGKLHETGIKAIENYSKIGPVIVSCWDSDDFSLLSNLNAPIKLIVNKNVDKISDYERSERIDNDGNVFFQTITTLSGLLAVDTEYAVKVRSDELWTNFDRFRALLDENRDKIISNDRYARPTAGGTEYHFHLADTLFGGKTEVLIDSFMVLKESLKKNEFRDMIICGQKRILSAEQKIYISILKILEPNFSFNECREIMKKHFLICPCAEFLPYLVNSSGWKSKGKIDWNNFNCLTDINKI